MPGDLLVIRCTPAEIVNRGNPYEFDYRFFMENQGIRYFAFTNSSRYNKIILFPAHRKLIHRALIIREKIIRMYRERGITGERLALVSAITLGQKRMLDPEQKHNFMKAGVMHIMAVSGLHAIILSLFVLNLLFFMKRRFNILRIGITITDPLGICICNRTDSFRTKSNPDVFISSGRKTDEKTCKRN